jgi:FAD/FMN-containing dehydrogenase
VQHEGRVAEVVAQLRARTAADGFASLRKTAVSHFVPNPRDPRHADKKIDVRALSKILEIDVEGRTCTAEPGLTFSDLVRATLPHGLAPTLVPELEAITIGGAVAGCAIESMAYKHGGFHDSCLEYEVVVATGEVLLCSRDQNREIFDMLHGSYGTLGIITKLKFRLIPAKPFVRMEYQVHETCAAFGEHLARACVAADVDFVDAIIHARDRFVLCVGRFAETAPYSSSYTGTNIYYRSTLTRREDYLSTYDYFFRYDTDCHWSTRVLPGMDSKIGRALFGKVLLGSTNLLRWSQRLRPVLKHRRRRRVVDDLLIPKRRFAEFYGWYEREVGYFPLWIVPYRMPEPYPWIADAHHARARDAVYVDFAVYGLPNDRPNIDYSKLLEEMTFEFGGIKALISDNHYDQATFWSIYNRERYERVKSRTDPQNLFRGLYEKFHFESDAGAPEAPRGSTAVTGRSRAAG